ncbi:hypothetical protein BR93DRAFT_558941 [Coniochaeta sp. PMI_546]|nr:hypothetical protein BR93DRAFT_558941 [Coniochaeta sp. PMI_546]
MSYLLVGARSSMPHVCPVRCPFDGCVHRTAEQREMRRHTESTHGMAKILKCHFCQQEIRSRKDNLLRHIQEYHDPTWSFKR